MQSQPSSLSPWPGLVPLTSDEVDAIWQIGCLKPEATGQGSVVWVTEKRYGWFRSVTYTGKHQISWLFSCAQGALTTLGTALSSFKQVAGQSTAFSEAVARDMTEQAQAPSTLLLFRIWNITSKTLLHDGDTLTKLLKDLDGVTLTSEAHIEQCASPQAVTELAAAYKRALSANERLRHLKELDSSLQQIRIADKRLQSAATPTLLKQGRECPLRALGAEVSFAQISEVFAKGNQNEVLWAYLLNQTCKCGDLQALVTAVRAYFGSQSTNEIQTFVKLLIMQRTQWLSPKQIADMYRALTTAGLDPNKWERPHLLNHGYHTEESFISLPNVEHEYVSWGKRYKYAITTRKRAWTCCDLGAAEGNDSWWWHNIPNYPLASPTILLEDIRNALQLPAAYQKRPEQLTRLLSTAHTLEQLQNRGLMVEVGRAYSPIIERAFHCLQITNSDPSDLLLQDFSSDAKGRALFGGAIAKEMFGGSELSCLAPMMRWQCVGRALQLIATHANPKKWDVQAVGSLVLDGLGPDYWNLSHGTPLLELQPEPNVGELLWKARIYLAMHPEALPVAVRPDEPVELKDASGWSINTK